MGMISRVRGRVRSDSFSKVHTMKSKEKIANIVWLLSVVLILPYWVPRGLFVALGGAWLMALYTCLVLPVLISANYHYPARWYPAVARLAQDCVRRLRGPLAKAGVLMRTAYAPVERAEQLLLQMNNLSTMISQLLMFTACDRLLTDDEGSRGRLTSLYSLMFFNVVTYSVSYVREMYLKEDWSPYVNVTRHSRVKHLAMSATKIVLEWTKAVTFVTTVTIVLMALGLEQGLTHYRPSTAYTTVTAAYYLLTERTFVELWPAALATLRLERLEGMEALYCAVWACGGALALAAPLPVALMLRGRGWRLAAPLAGALWLVARPRLVAALRRLRDACGSLQRFRRAARAEVAALEDVCAVCLGGMREARVTPCAHYFHAECLRRCLAASDRCPLCVRPFVFC